MRFVAAVWLAGVALYLSACGGTPVAPGCTPDCTERTCGDDGCGGSCGGCKPWQVCPGTACILDTMSKWDLVADRGSVSVQDSEGDRWDGLFDAAPDPYVCVAMDGKKQCTDVQENNFSPIWEKTLYTGVLARTLQSGFFVQYYEEDGMTDDIICYGDILVRTSEFNAGFLDATCDGNTSDVIFKLVHRPE